MNVSKVSVSRRAGCPLRGSSVSRKLGNFLDEWIAIRRAEQEGSGERFQEQAARLAALEEEQYRLREHQEFMESLKEKEEPSIISSGD